MGYARVKKVEPNAGLQSVSAKNEHTFREAPTNTSTHPAESTEGNADGVLLRDTTY